MRAQTVQTIAVHVLFCTAHALTLFPLAWMVMASFVHAGEASGYPPRWLPSERASISTGRCSRGSTSRGDTDLMMAGAVFTVLPVLARYAALQGYYIQGIMLGSIKD